MRIMLTNDDGYFAEGIQHLYKYLKNKNHDVYIVAPSQERSAASSSLTIREPLKVEKINEYTYSVEGTPVDCVKLGLSHCSNGIYPDLVVSGINPGPNLGTDTLYSGTVGAALDAAVLGFPSIALSSTFDFAKDGAGEDFDKYLDRAFEIATTSNVPKYTMLNINIPRANIKGIKLVPVGMVIYRGDYNKSEKHEDVYHIAAMRDGRYNLSNDVDDKHFYEGYMTVTPLTYDLTDYSFMRKLKDLGIEK